MFVALGGSFRRNHGFKEAVRTLQGWIEIPTKLCLLSCRMENHFFACVFDVMFTETSVQPKIFGVV